MTLAVGERYRERIGTALCALTGDILWIPDNPSVDPRLAGHADLSVFPLDRSAVCAAPGVYNNIVNKLTNRGISVFTASAQGEVYPKDCGLCVCDTGKYTIYSEKWVDPVVRPYLGGIPVRVAQGYTNCAVCVVSSDAVITSDAGIARDAQHAGLDVLLIQPGHIILDGYPYGFIGGASGKLDEYTILFTGSLDGHPDRKRILDFLQNYGVTPIFLTKEPIFDIGGLITLP